MSLRNQADSNHSIPTPEMNNSYTGDEMEHQRNLDILFDDEINVSGSVGLNTFVQVVLAVLLRKRVVYGEFSELLKLRIQVCFKYDSVDNTSVALNAGGGNLAPYQIFSRGMSSKLRIQLKSEVVAASCDCDVEHVRFGVINMFGCLVVDDCEFVRHAFTSQRTTSIVCDALLADRTLANGYRLGHFTLHISCHFQGTDLFALNLNGSFICPTSASSKSKWSILWR